MNTRKLYQKDPYQRNCLARIVDIVKEETHSLLILDQTVFFPTGGGQSCDRGTINDIPIVDVYEKEGIIFHKIEDSNSNIVWNPDQEIFCEIDWDHRFLNMQRHCGEHILSGIFYREYGGVNRGFHMGDSYMTIDISLEANPDIETLTWDMAQGAEHLANQVVWADAPVIVRHFDTRAEAEHLPLRKPLALEEDITIVCVGDTSQPADCVACCGTHPKSAAQVGLIKILKVENYKGMFRIYCEAGRKAMDLFDQYHQVLSRLNQRYSASSDDLPEKIAAQEEKHKEVRNQLYQLKQSLIQEQIAGIIQDLENPELKHQRLLVREYDHLKIDDLLHIGRPLIPKLSRLLLLLSRSENTVLLFSGGKPDCGRLVKENASIYQGKGGGSGTNARAIFSKGESLDTFIDLLDKHLR